MCHGKGEPVDEAVMGVRHHPEGLAARRGPSSVGRSDV